MGEIAFRLRSIDASETAVVPLFAVRYKMDNWSAWKIIS